MSNKVKIHDIYLAARTQARTVNTSVALVVIYLLSQNSGSLFGRVEGRLLPVIENTEITKVMIDLDGILISGSFDIFCSCLFFGIRWYLHEGDKNVPIQVQFIEGAKIREEGRFQFGPWLLNVSPKQLNDQTYAEVDHICHPFFLTVSRFYRSEKLSE